MSEDTGPEFRYPGVWLLAGTSPRTDPGFIRELYRSRALVLGLGRLSGLDYPVHGMVIAKMFDTRVRPEMSLPLFPVFLRSAGRINVEEGALVFYAGEYASSVCLGISAAIKAGASDCILHGVDLEVRKEEPFYYPDLSSVARIRRAVKSAEYSREVLPELLEQAGKAGVRVFTTDAISGMDIPVISREGIRDITALRKLPQAVTRKHILSMEGRPTPEKRPRSKPRDPGILPPTEVRNLLRYLQQEKVEDMPPSMRVTIAKLDKGCTGCQLNGMSNEVSKIVSRYAKETVEYLRERFPEAKRLGARIPVPGLSEDNPNQKETEV